MSTKVLAALPLLFALGCSSSTNTKVLDGTYSVQVTGFGKTDPDSVIVSTGDKALLLDFSYGFYTDAGAVNATGVRAMISGDKVTIVSQPVHVEHSTGPIDGSVTGTGTLTAADLSLTLSVLPANFPIASGTTVDFTLTGTHE